MIKSGLNILAWYDTKQKQDHRRWWNYNGAFPIISEFSHIPAFQLVRNKTGAAINVLSLVKLDDDTEQNILSSAQSSGLEVAEFDHYDLVIYPDLLPLDITNLELGIYYLKMSDGANTWYSEVFSMCIDTSNLIKIEYWHNEDFKYSNGHIRYNAPFKNKVFIGSDIGKPSYEYEEQVVKNDGYNFPINQISFKKFKFNTILPEFLIDAIRVIGLHDNIEISYSGRCYEVDEFLMDSPKWEDRGDIANVEFEFRTDTVVSISGRGSIGVDYEPQAGSCVVHLHSCVAMIEEGTDNYTNFTYTNSSTGQVANLQDGDKVIITLLTGDIQVFTYNASSYSVQATPNGSVIYTLNEDLYFSGIGSNKIKLPYIQGYSTSQGLLLALSLQGALHYIYSVSGGVETLIGTYTAAQIDSNVEIEYDPSFEFFRMKVASLNCGVFQTSEDLIVVAPEPDNIFLITIEDDYLLTIDNDKLEII